MRFALRAALVVLASALPLSLALPAMPSWWNHRPFAGGWLTGNPFCARNALGPGVATAADQGGCCHFGGGVCGCQGGRVQCCKGNLTSSCPCGPRATDPPETRGPGRDGPPLQLRTAAFTNKTTGPPLFRLTASRAGEAVWFWLELDCPGPCLKQLTIDAPDLRVTVYWYFDPGSGPMLREDLKMEQAVASEPQPPRVAIPVTLPVGNWIAEVGFGADRVCMKDDTCAFRLRVTR